MAYEQNVLSDLAVTLMIEEFGGQVEKQFAKSSIMREFVTVRPVRGTDTITNNRVGRTTLKKLVPGLRPASDETPFGKVSLTVDTTILARDARSMLNEFQTHFNVRAELAEDQGKELGKFFDQAFIIMAIKGAGMPAPVLGDGTAAKQSIGGGNSVTLAAAGDELDPNKLYKAIKSITVTMEEQEIPTDELVIFMRPTDFDTLLEHPKLFNRDFNVSVDNGNYSQGSIYELNGVRVVKTTRIPRQAIIGHKLSNPRNGNAYDVSATEAKAVAVIMHPRSLLAGETIPITSDIWFNREEKTWFIDSFIAFGASVNRPDLCGRVLKF